MSAPRFKRLVERLRRLEIEIAPDEEPVLIRFVTRDCRKGASEIAKGELHELFGEGTSGLKWQRNPGEAESEFVDRALEEAKDSKPGSRVLIGYASSGSDVANAPLDAAN